MNIILMGPQGSGKGTLARQITKGFGLPQISTGDLLREQMKNETELGKLAKSYVNKGSLVPLDVILKILEDRISRKDCKNGYILDGFPRSKEQAEALKEIAKIDAVFVLEIPSDVIIKRILTRRVCSSCGEIYNTSSYSDPTCKCGAPLYQRDDDKSEAAIRNRLEIYDRETAPLVDFYSDRVYKLDGSGSPAEVYARAKILLENLEARK